MHPSHPGSAARLLRRRVLGSGLPEARAAPPRPVPEAPSGRTVPWPHPSPETRAQPVVGRLSVSEDSAGFPVAVIPGLLPRGWLPLRSWPGRPTRVQTQPLVSAQGRSLGLWVPGSETLPLAPGAWRAEATRLWSTRFPAEGPALSAATSATHTCPAAHHRASRLGHRAAGVQREGHCADRRLPSMVGAVWCCPRVDRACPCRSPRAAPRPPPSCWPPCPGLPGCARCWGGTRALARSAGADHWVPPSPQFPGARVRPGHVQVSEHLCALWCVWLQLSPSCGHFSKEPGLLWWRKTFRDGTWVSGGSLLPVAPPQAPRTEPGDTADVLALVA